MRKTALVFAYSFFVAFGTAAMLVIEKRPLDERGLQMVALMSAGAFIGSLMTLLFAKRLAARRPFWRFVLTFALVALATLAAQSLLTGVQFYAVSYAVHDPFTTLGGWMELAFTSASGFAYFYVFGLGPFWPVVAAAAALFALGFQTLHISTE